MLNKFVLSAGLFKVARLTVKAFSSPTTIAVVKLAVAVVTVFQAIDALSDSKRQIGFKKD